MYGHDGYLATRALEYVDTAFLETRVDGFGKTDIQYHNEKQRPWEINRNAIEIPVMYVPLLGKIPTTSGSCLFRRIEVVRYEPVRCER
jgi:hypothetical protein